MPFLQDDHLISIGMIVIILSSAIFGILWGLLADKKGPPFAIILFIILDLGSKIFSSLVISRVGFIISMVLLGGTDKAMLILFAPTLIDCFGLRVASQLLPFKGLSGILSVIFAAALGFIFAKFPPQYSLYWLCFFSVINIPLGICLANIVRK
jgi:MFS family permease